MADGTHLTLGVAALLIGAKWHHLDRMHKRGVIRAVGVGPFRAVAVADLDKIKAECQKRGYLKAPAAAGVA